MTDKITLAVYIGTTRAQRQSDKAAQYIAECAKQRDNVDVVLVDPLDFSFEGDGNDPEGKDAAYTAIVERADAFFMVVPEYNHSFPGSLKRMVDSELALYNHKPVALAGASSGGWGGVRGVESFLTAIRETGLVAMSWDIYFPRVQDIFAADGTMKPEHRERYDEQTGKLLDELLWFAKLLKANR